nr:diguanylate cyclase [Ochrobactrum vermis]
MMIDIDHFKLINNALGHLEGDSVIRDVALLIVNRRLNGTPYRRPKSTPPLGCKV